MWLEWDLFGDKLSNIIWVFTMGSLIVLVSAGVCLWWSPNPNELAYYYEDIPTLATLSHTHEASKRYATGITFLKSIDEDPDQYTDTEIKTLLQKDHDKPGHSAHMRSSKADDNMEHYSDPYDSGDDERHSDEEEEPFEQKRDFLPMDVSEQELGAVDFI
ncbi:hypothetical protein RFI_06419 [Reticulomyxa filosa]|uniref:Uncharacterized protein n=1 Tax=Reticulomyxa filosa TaxID=46433 RepID=X6NXU8_RETFI|nr:hypothetical protein RFI_06419 [Reticulomyxa filosa]|eukprot:ETO30708.1 hypothetical protein RFI_06419 [Reticulomyxa filosa]